MIVCICRKVCDRTVLRVIQEGAETIDDVSSACRAGSGCGACHETIQELLDDAAAGEAGCPRRSGAILSPYLQTA
jgi:bacterioferritin-associated ferredoxin